MKSEAEGDLALHRSETVQVRCTDGVQLAATVYFPAQSEAVLQAIIINPALAVPQTFYAPLAAFLANHGFYVVTYDYRGIAESRSDELVGSKIRMHQWGQLDLDTVFRWVKEKMTPKHIWLIGHSVGGQLVGLASHSKLLSGMVVVASQSGYWRNFAPAMQVTTFFLWHVLLPLLSIGRNSFPARLLGLASVDLPSGVAREWARWGRTPGYLFNPRYGFDLSAYRNLQIPILAYSFTDDAIAPQTAVGVLLREYPNCNITHRHLSPEQLGVPSVGHFGFFREPVGASFWQETVDWLRSHDEDV
ncbi:MAG: alpha/beta fold hydrolase [Mariprofundaceae bacterium]